MLNLTSVERIRKAMSHEKSDVMPVGTFMGNHAAKVAGIPLMQYYTDSKKMVEAQTIAWEKYQQDIMVMQSDNYYIAEGFGMKANYYENSTPTFKEPAIQDLKDVSKLKIPNPWNDGRMHVYLEAIKMAKERFKNGEVAIRGCGTGPFALASHLIGTEKFLMAIAEAQYGLSDNEDAILNLMELSTEALLQFCIAQFECGADIVQCGDSLASLDVISPATYEKYVFPYEKKFFEKLKPYAEKYNGYGLLHVCGNNTKVLDLYAQLGADCYEVDHKVDLKECKQRIGDKICLMGNLNPTEILLRGTVEEVEKESIACIEAAGKDGGFILGSGCEVPINAPEENIKAMVRIARNYKY